MDTLFKKKRNQQSKASYKSASMTRRFLAYIIDWYLGALCTALPIAIISQQLTHTTLNQDIRQIEAPYGIIAGILAMLFAMFYFIIIPTYIYSGQTIGKKICRIKMIKTNDEPVTLKNMLLRQLLGIIIIEGVLYSASTIWREIVTIITKIDVTTSLMYVGFVISGISILLYLFKGEQRALHDYLGSTKVVMQTIS